MRLVTVEHMQRDDQFFQRRVAGSLAQAVGATVNHFCSGLDTCQLRRHRHAEIVMRVDFDRQIRPRLHQPHNVFDGFRERAAHGVDHADRIRRRVLHNSGQEILEVFFARPSRVVGKIDHVQASGLGVVDDANALF